ncbi:proteoglycan 4 isoform X2 [Myxocyprinus asiaticus]|uniref:proteoglycan 4 isoform X2 n=1 Tax=Myxocyprinus asiaticus TaxID=70543 RepID=UPI0022225011|nr:proteoglycan 4 isoform X2 [Myxocyprinus asiaticus]
MSQGKAKKKLHYLQEEKWKSEFKVKDVFTLRGIDNLFDDIDADSDLGLPLLSPLLKSADAIEHKKSRGPSNPDKIKTPSIQGHKDALIQENGIQEGEITDKESPFKEIVPIKTSSPIAMETDGGEEEVRLVADPLLFGVEDEEPIGGDLSKPPCPQQSEAVKESFSGDSGSLASPPERVEFRKATKPNAGSSTCMKTSKSRKTAFQATQSLPPDIKEDFLMDKDPSCLSTVLVQKNEQKLEETEQCKDQMPEKGLSFQHKIKKALMPKSSCSRKPAASPAPPPVDFEEDFMILDDEAPVLFIIPRKSGVCRKKRTVTADSAKECVSAEPHSIDQLSQSETDTNNQEGADSKRSKAQSDSDNQKPKGKHRKASKKNSKELVTHDGLEDRPDPLTQGIEDGFCDRSPSQTVQGNKVVDSTGKQSTKKISDPDELSEKDGTNAGGSHEIPVPMSRNKKKSSSSQPDRPGSKAKKESKKVISVTGPQTTSSVKVNKNGKNSNNGKTITKTKKRTSKQQKELEQKDPACEQQDLGEAPPALNEQEEAQRTAVNKQSAKQDAFKNPAKKQKGKETKTVESKPKDPPTIALDTSSESAVTAKRMRKPPGAWWLASQDDSTTECQAEAVLGTAQGPNSSKKTITKQAVAVAVDSNEIQSLRPAQGNQKKPKTSATHSAVENVKKLLAHGEGDDTGAEQKMPKKTVPRKKRKSATTQQQVPSPTPVSGEEVKEDRQEAFLNESAEQVSPALCSPYRQHNITPGEKRVFGKVYTRYTGSSQKNPSSVRSPESCVPDDIPQKRQRKAPSYRWESPPSQEATDGPPSPHNAHPQQSKPPNSPISGAFKKGANLVKSQKTKSHIKNIKRNIINTPKSIKRSLASMNDIFASEKAGNIIKTRQKRRKHGRRNLLHSLDDQSEHSSENMAHSDDQLQGNSHASFGFTSGVTVEPSGTRNKKIIRVSSGPNTLSDIDTGFRSGPSSMIDLQGYEEEEDDIELPSSRVIVHVRHGPRVLAQCDLCGPPLQPIILEEDDWNNLHAWFSHLWPPASKDGRVVSPDDFHWHSYGGRAIGHAVDLQSSSFSHGKILLGSFMKKPPQVDLDTVSVFSIISSCVRVDIDGIKSVYNSGQVFMIPSGQVYTIHNLCQEPAVLIYHRTQSNISPS